MKAAIYARVSKKDKQEVESQLLQLTAYCAKHGHEVYRQYVDRQSGGTGNRTEFKQLFIDAHQGKFDIVIFWALDRFSREGARETINHLAQLEACGVGFISYTEPYLNSIGVFKDAIISILATLAKQERVRIQERVKAGLERARKNGKRLGRKGLSPIDRQRILELRREGVSMAKIAKKLKLSKGVVHKTLAEREAGRVDAYGFKMTSNLWTGQGHLE